MEYGLDIGDMVRDFKRQIDALNTDLKKLEDGAIGCAKQTERKKKQRLRAGKEKLLNHYNLEKEGVKGRLTIALKKIDTDIEKFLASKEAEKKRLNEEYDAKIENYYSPHIASLYEDGSDASDEVFPTYSPTYYAKRAERDALERKLQPLMMAMDTPAYRDPEYKPVKKIKVKQMLVKEEGRTTADEELDAIHKRLEMNSFLHRQELDRQSEIKQAKVEAELQKLRDQARADDRALTIGA